MILADFVTQIEKNYVVKILQANGAPIITPANTTLASQYATGGLLIGDMLGYSEFGGGIREPFKIGVTWLRDAPDSYALAADGAAQLKYRNETAQTAVDMAQPALSTETIKEIPADVIKISAIVITEKVLP